LVTKKIYDEMTTNNEHRPMAFFRTKKSAPAPETTDGKAERRRSPRTNVAYAAKWPGGNGHLVNISDHGLLIDADHSLLIEIGSQFRATIEIPDTLATGGKRYALVEAKVVRLSPFTGGRQAIGADLQQMRFG
jgi:PilZ domain